MRIKKFISGFIAVVLALVSLALCASAATQDIPISVTLREATRNMLISSAKKTSSNTTYDAFSWTGGTTNSVTIWIKNDAGDIVGPKTQIEKNAGFVSIWYRSGVSFTEGATAYMYAEQHNIVAKTLFGTARFT